MPFTSDQMDIRRQYPRYAMLELGADDLANAFDAASLPPNAIVIGGWLDVKEAFDAGTITIGDDLGDTPDVDKYLTSQILTTGAMIPFTATLPLTNSAIPVGGAMITVNPASVTGTAGKAQLCVIYVEEGTHHEYFTYRG